MLRALALAVAVVTVVQAQAPPRDSAPAKPVTGTAVIRGRVLVEGTGTPVRRAIVTVSNLLAVVRTVYTDGRGRYEIRDLPGGSYAVVARPNQLQAQYLQVLSPPTSGLPRVLLIDSQILDGHDLQLARAGAIVGRVVDEGGDSISGISLSATLIGDPPGSSRGMAQTSDELGRWRIFGLSAGEYRIVARPMFSGGEVVGGTSMGLVETYYPGVPSAEGAARVRVRAGQETAAGDFVLVPARMHSIQGTVIGADGQPATPRTNISLAQPGGGSTGTSLRPGGRFSFQAQPPGDYQLTVVQSDEATGLPVEYASMRVTLSDATPDDDLVVTMKPAATVAGRVAFDGQPPQLARDGLSIRPEGTTPTLNVYRRAATVAADLTFTLRGAAGEVVLRPVGLPTGWLLKSVMLDDRDITDVPHEFKDTDSNHLTVVLTTRYTELKGSITNDDGSPGAGAQIVFFSEDKKTWFPRSRRVGLLFSVAGRFQCRLPPGSYYLVALPRSRALVERNGVLDPKLLESLIADATRVFIGENESRQVDLKVLPALEE